MQKPKQEERLCAACGQDRKASQHKLCYTCRSKRRRNEDPVWAVYYTLRSNAKRRRVKFRLSFDWFKKFILGTDYMEKRGRTAEDLTIDRIVNPMGYVDGNLQILTREANASKGCRDEKGRLTWSVDVDRDGAPF